MPHFKTPLHTGQRQPPHCDFATVKPRQFDIQMIYHLGLRALFVKLMHMRELRKWSMKHRLAKSLWRRENVMPKPEHNRQNAKHRDFRPRLAIDLHIRAVPQHPNMLFPHMEQGKAPRIPEKYEHHLA